MPAYLFIIQTSVCIGFISADFVHVHHTQSTLFIIGIATMITGILSFILNRVLCKKRNASSTPHRTDNCVFCQNRDAAIDKMIRIKRCP